MAASLLLLLLHLASCLVSIVFASQPDAPWLLELKGSITHDPSGLLSTWPSNSDAFPCAIQPYPGIICNNASINGRVIKVDLSNGGLVGRIPFATLPSLPLLQHLNLSGNSFSGNFSDLSRLPGVIAQLDLSHNKISGTLPQNLFSGCGNLTVLDLSDNQIVGPLPPGFDLCHSLQRLDLSSNSLGGPILVNFPGNLQILDLSLNNFTGSIPDTLFNSCSSFISLDLSSNKFTGKLPPLLQKCILLKMLNVSVNQLNDQIPSFLGALGSIQKLYMSNNHLVGPIPNELGGLCPTLLELDLSSNNITGSIPPPFASCSNLQTLNLASNNLSGGIPGNIISSLQSLRNLLLAFNSFSGEFPISVTNCSNLKVLDLSSNNLNGLIPENLCPPGFLIEELYAPNNHFSGMIPLALVNCSKLRVLDFSFNHLSGSIPPELSLLTELETISMWYNGLSGPIPPQLGSLKNLRNLILNNNFLTGSIPVELTNCSRMEWLSLTSNKLTGVIPSQIGNMKMLTLLELGNNSLTGNLPTELGGCINLLWLDVNSNYITGPIPSILGRLASGPPENRTLSGDVFEFVRNKGLACRSMGTLVDIKGIPDSALAQTPLTQACNSTTLYNNRTLTSDPDFSSIQYVDLSYNMLEGNIPEGMGHSHALEVLDLSHNNLIGPIPSTFTHLKYLGLLDLSYNRLEGGLWPLENCTFIVEMDLSNNNFSGPIPSAGQLYTAPAASFANNPGLCDFPLAPCGSRPSPNASRQKGCSSNGHCNRPVAVLSWVNCIVLGVLVSIACFCALIIWAIMARSRNKRKDTVLLTTLQSASHGISTWNLSTEKEPLSINVATFERPLKKLTFSHLVEATNGFSPETLIGTGGFGEVYKAKLRDGTIVAIKKLLQFSFQGDREFTAEMETLGKIKHRNLVPLLGYCKVGEERLLVYDYMHGGSLYDLLHGINEEERERPNWELRKQIAKGAARGLSFLHHNCIPHIIHRDMKSSNVLLDKNLEARVSDFGMARLISALDTHLSVSTLAGTPGYVPPEYYQSFRCTTKGDIYSFGVILLELLTGKRPTNKEEFEDSNLVGWVKLHVGQNRSMEVLDPELVRAAGDGDRREMLQCLKIACDCLDDVPSRRPTMLQVVARFKEVVLNS